MVSGRNGSWTAVLPLLTLSALAGGVLAVNTPMPDTIWIGLGVTVMAFGCLRLGALGDVLLRADLAPELRFILGFVLLAYVLALPVHLLGVSILWPAALFLIAALILPPGTGRRTTTVDPAATLLALLAAAGFAAIWSHESTARVADFPVTGIYRMWLDFFSHASTIAEFGDPRALGRGSILLADTRPGFYHFASFAIPGLAVRLTDMPPLQAVTAVWLPAGIFATALGVMALGRALSGLAGGAIALVLLEALPDTASYGLKQGFLSFHWMLETAPGSLYALPCSCAACCLLVAWCQDADWRALAGSGLLFAATFLLRANIFIWLAGPWAATAVVGWQRPTAWVKCTLLAAGAIVATAGMLVIAHQDVQANGIVQYLTRYIIFLHSNQPPTAYDGLFPWLVQRLGPMGALLPGIGLAWLGMGGIPLLIFLGGAIVIGCRRGLRSIDMLPFASLLWAAMLMVLAPTPFNGDFGEFRQRGFALVTVILICWSARWVAMLAPRWTSARPMALASCAALPITATSVAGWKAPRMQWAGPFITTRVSLHLIAAASWLRQAAGPASAFTMADLNPTPILFDDATAVVGLSGVPAWVARPEIEMRAGGSRAAETQRRLQVLAEAAAAPDAAAAFQTLRAARVYFYIVTNRGEPGWDPTHAEAAFRDGDVAIYRTGAAP